MVNLTEKRRRLRPSNIESLKDLRFIKTSDLLKNTKAPTNLKNTKDKYQDYLSTLNKYVNLKKYNLHKSNLNHGNELNKNLDDLKKKRKKKYF